MRADATAVQAGSPAGSRPVTGKLRLATVRDLDGRTRASRRARELAAGFERDLGGDMSPGRRLAIERAAAMVALAEDAQARRLAGDQTVSLEDVVRIDNAAARAVKAIGIKLGQPVHVPLRERLAREAAEAAGEG